MSFLRKLLGKEKPTQIPGKKAEPLHGTFHSVLICGQTDSVSPAYEQSERRLVERIVAEHKSQIQAGTRIKTMRGPSLPDAASTAGIEGAVRILQMRLGIGLLSFQAEFRTQDGYSFMVVYMK